jgi:hypothetical protein
MGHQGAVLAILKQVLNIVDANGFVLEGLGFNIIHKGVTILLYEGNDKCYHCVTQLEDLRTIKQELRDLCDCPGMEVHGTIYTLLKLVLGGDMKS